VRVRACVWCVCVCVCACVRDGHLAVCGELPNVAVWGVWRCDVRGGD
jgi:hypothetical protein